MNNDPIKYIEDQLHVAENRLEEHIKKPNGELYPKRYIYKKLETYIQDFIDNKSHLRWILLHGLRGVGKTTVFAQLFLKFLKITDKNRILYISLDNTKLLDISLLDVIDSYEKILREPFEKLTKPIILFIDEVHYESNWGLLLKSLYDRTKKIFILCSISSPTKLKTNPDISRRVTTERLYPLSFTEYQMLLNKNKIDKELSEEISQSLYYSENSKEAYNKLSKLQSKVSQYFSNIDKFSIEHYLTRGTLPFTLGVDNLNRIFRSIDDLLYKIIQNDIQNLKSFDQKTILSIKKILLILSDSNGIISFNKFTKLTDISSKITIQEVMKTLEKAEILIKIPPNRSPKTTKPSKYLFMLPIIRMFLLGIRGKDSIFRMNMGKFLEDVVGIYLKKKFIHETIGNITYDPKEGGADFILQIANKKQIIIEVGMGKKDGKQIINTMEKVSGNYGIVICDTELKHLKEQNIIKLPIKFFLLM